MAIFFGERNGLEGSLLDANPRLLILISFLGGVARKAGGRVHGNLSGAGNIT